MSMNPAHYCRYCVGGACLHPELENPGFDRSLRCAVLAGLVSGWDDFLDRAELFGLPEDSVARIWNGRNHRKTLAKAGCMRRTAPPPFALEDVETCFYRVRDICLLALPACTGRCEHFADPSGHLPEKGGPFRME